MSEHPIQKAVESTRDCLIDSFAVKPAFLAAHFSFGTPGNPGYVIKSAAIATDCHFSEWAKNDNGKSEEVLHARVIVQHARQFQRGVTVPALLARLAQKHKKRIFLTLNVIRSSEPLCLKESKTEKHHELAISLSEKFALALCSEELPHQYFKELYGASIRNHRPKALTEGELELPRCEAFGILISESTNLESIIDSLIIDPLIGYGPKELKRKAWALLGTLQSALLYFRGSQSQGGTAETSGFACAFPLISFRRNAEIPYGFALGGPLLEFEFSKVRECFENCLWTDEVKRHVYGNHITKQKEALEKAVSSITGMERPDIKRLSSILKREITGIVPFPGPQKRLQLLGLWLIYLISKLKGAKHEGKPVDFWLVAGEQSEFADDVDVRLDKHPFYTITKSGNERKREQDKEFEFDKFLDLGGKITLDERVCNLICRRLEREHYPWFSRGRHALFFDSSSEGLSPLGLAELRAGSWNRLVSESFRLPDEQELNIPGCLVAFVDATTGESGLLICQPAKPEIKQRASIKRVLRHKAGKWHVASDDRELRLNELLKENVSWLSSGAHSTMLSQMATMIADDPHAGGTLVFVKTEPAADEFLRLGAPWDFDLFKQDKIPLISHDGATVVWMGKDDLNNESVKMDYRTLLTPQSDHQSISIQNHLQAGSLGSDFNFPLLGVGTRRWSAALAALRSNVSMVVVISTDGDITCWWSKNGKERKLFCQSLTTAFDPSDPKCGPKNVLAGLSNSGKPRRTST